MKLKIIPNWLFLEHPGFARLRACTVASQLWSTVDIFDLFLAMPLANYVWRRPVIEHFDLITNICDHIWSQILITNILWSYMITNLDHKFFVIIYDHKSWSQNFCDHIRSQILITIFLWSYIITNLDHKFYLITNK